MNPCNKVLNNYGISIMFFPTLFLGIICLILLKDQNKSINTQLRNVIIVIAFLFALGYAIFDQIKMIK